jgi:hypothetical protein
MKPFSIFIPALLSTLLCCSGDKGKSFLPPIPGYNAADKNVVVLEKDLLEISGISVTENNMLAAINDEDGKIFLVDPATGSYTVSKFGKKRDYEDIVKLGAYFYVLESNGNIHRVPANDPETEEEIEYKRDKRVEFESLYFDPSIGKLVLLTKEQREKKKTIMAFTFDTASLVFSDDPYFVLKLEEIEKLMKDNSAQCKPSAASIQPVTKKLFILASVGKVILQCNLRGELEKVYDINPNQFPQPEGLCFASNGDMYVSNEGVNGKATLIRFPYVP